MYEVEIKVNIEQTFGKKKVQNTNISSQLSSSSYSMNLLVLMIKDSFPSLEIIFSSKLKVFIQLPAHNKYD